MMVADEIRALLLIHDRLNAWERPFIRDMAKRLEQRRSLTVKQLATVRRILDRYRVWTVQVQAHPISRCCWLSLSPTCLRRCGRPVSRNRPGSA